MDAATQRQWEVWANALVLAKLQAFAEIMGEEAARQEKLLLTHFNAELKRLDDRIAALQVELDTVRTRNVTPLRIAAHVA
jgi:hypothetical protein